MIDISESDIIACICEGSAEKFIIDILCENNKLIFSKDQLLNEEILTGKFRSSKHFIETYLKGINYAPNKLLIVRILDKPQSDKFVLTKAYKEKVQVINCVTKPEIEMIMLAYKGWYEEYQKVNNIKPSTFLAEKMKLKTKDIKKYSFIEDMFQNDLLGLEEAIKKISKNNNKNEKSIVDLLKKK